MLQGKGEAKTTTALTSYGEEQPISHDDGETTTTKTPTVIELDSLPYIDDIHPDYEAYAITLIEEEMQTMPPPPPTSSLDHLVDQNGIPLSFTRTPHNTINHTEYKALAARNGAPRPSPIDYTQTYTVTPSPTTLPQWETALSQTKVQLEHEQSRLLNLELQSHYESALWQRHIATTLPTRYAEPMATELRRRRLAVDERNAERKRVQEVEAGPKLKVLEGRWTEVVERNRRLVEGIGVVGTEVERLRELVGGGAAGGIVAGAGVQ